MNKRHELMYDREPRRKRPALNGRTLKRALGVSNGKSLTLSNDCASNSITLERDEETGKVEYSVAADYLPDETFPTLEKALAYALRDLAELMDGSPNR